MRLQQSNSSIKRRWTEVHVALRCTELVVTRELLDRSRRRAAHRQVRAEGVAQHVNASVR